MLAFLFTTYNNLILFCFKIYSVYISLVYKDWDISIFLNHLSL